MIGLALLAGIPLILAGVIIKNSPEYVPGKNNLIEDNPSKIKKYKGLQSFAFYISGIIIILGGSISEILNIPKILGLTILFSSIISIPIFVYAGYKMSKNKKLFFKIDKKKMYILLPIILFTLFIFIYFTRETKIIIENNNIVIEGIYGETIPIESVEEIELLNKLPSINIRTNGFAIGYILKGYFNVSKEGNVKMFIHSSGSLIRLKTKSRIFYFNYKDSAKTINIYNEISDSKKHQ